MKLKNILPEKFQQAHLQKLKSEYFSILDNHLDFLFLGKAFALEVMKVLKTDDKKITRIYDQRYLPFRLHDIEWLVKYINKRYNDDLKSIYNLTKRGIATEELKYIPVDYIRMYVVESPVFEKKCGDFERNLVTAYLQVAQTCCDDFYADIATKKREIKSPEYDVLFRERVVNAMKYLGLDEDVVENTIEVKKDLWYDTTRKLTFVNVFNQKRLLLSQKERSMLLKKSPVAARNLVNTENKLFQSWNALCDIKYNQRHQSVIKQTKTATVNMKNNADSEYKLVVNTQKLSYQYKKQVVDCLNILNSEKNKQPELVLR